MGVGLVTSLLKALQFEARLSQLPLAFISFLVLVIHVEWRICYLAEVSIHFVYVI